MTLEKIAHRGFAAIAPENTLAAFKAALTYQADGVEFDVQLSLDKVPVIIHDLSLERTSNGQGLVKDYTITELKKLDTGAWFSDQFIDQSIPTFEEVLDFFASSNLKIYAEIKDTQNWTDQDLQNLVNLIHLKEYPSRCTIISFDYLLLQKINKLDHNIKIGYNSANLADYQVTFELALQNPHPLLLVEYHLLREKNQIIEECRENKIKIIAWTVDEIESQKYLINQGIQGIISNLPLS